MRFAAYTRDRRHGAAQPRGYTLFRPQHRAFTGTGLGYADTFGDTANIFGASASDAYALAPVVMYSSDVDKLLERQWAFASCKR